MTFTNQLVDDAVVLLATLISKSEEAELAAAEFEYLPGALVRTALIARERIDFEGTCFPDDAALGSFVRDELPLRQMVTMAMHVAKCDRCRERFSAVEGEAEQAYLAMVQSATARMPDALKEAPVAPAGRLALVELLRLGEFRREEAPTMEAAAGEGGSSNTAQIGSTDVTYRVQRVDSVTYWFPVIEITVTSGGPVTPFLVFVDRNTGEELGRKKLERVTQHLSTEETVELVKIPRNLDETDFYFILA